MTLDITISGTDDRAVSIAGTVTSIGTHGAHVTVAGLGARFIPRSTVTRVFCRKLGGSIDYVAALTEFNRN